MVKEFISQLPPDKLTPFAKHPYRVQEDAAMDELVESVRTHGVLSPLLARPKGEGAGQRASAAIGGAEIGPAHRAGAGAENDRR